VDPALWYIILIILIILSSFFSSTETAFSSVNQIRLKQYMEEGKKSAKIAYELYYRFEEVLLVIIILNNVVNFAAAGIAAIVVLDTFGEAAAIIGTLILTIVMIIFGEIIPKSYARANAEKMVLQTSAIFRLLIFILKPLIKILIFIRRIFSKSSEEKIEEPSVTEDELDVIINTMEEEGVLEEDEVEMLQGVLDLSDTYVKNIMTPRADVISLNKNSTIEQAKQKFLKHKFSRIPVYEDEHDNIIGLLYERELFGAILENGPEIELKSLIKEAVYVSSSMRVGSLLDKLRDEKQHLAIVIDEHGAASGIVTMEDIFEEVVGEIYDEHDEERQLIFKISDTSYEVCAEVALDDLCDLFDVNLKETDDDIPVGTWVYEKLEDLPEVGNVIVYNGLRFELTQVENRRIIKILVEYLGTNEED